MKKLFSTMLCCCLLLAMTILPGSAATLTGTNAPLLISEVAAYPNEAKDFGSLIEIYNNNDVEIDLYDYKIDISKSRAADKMMLTDNLKGGFYLSGAKNQIKLKAGEIAVLRVVTKAEQKSFTEADVRAAMGNIPAATKIVFVDATDPAIGYLDPAYYLTNTSYLIANLRTTEAGATEFGAFVRLYPESGKGKSQTYGDIGLQAQPMWEADLTATSAKADANVACTFGTLDENQKNIFKNAYIPTLETTSAPETTKAPVTTKAPETTQAPSTTTAPASTPNTGDISMLTFVGICSAMLAVVWLRKQKVN